MDKNRYQITFNRYINDLRYAENVFVSVVNNHATIYYKWNEMLLSYHLTYDVFESYITSDKNKWRDIIENDMKKEFTKQATENINRYMERFRTL